MTEEVKVEEAVEVAEAEVTPTPVTIEKRTPQELHQEKQGKKATTKKKVGRYSKAEAQAEIYRLKKGGQEASTYYKHVLSRLMFLGRCS